MHRRLLPLALSAVVATALVAAPAVAQRGAANHPQRKMFRSSIRVNTTARMHLSVRPRPAAVNWTKVANMKVAVAENGGGAFLKKKVYVPGGYTNFSVVPPTAYAHMQTYNTSTNTWSAETELIPAAPPGGGFADMAVCSDGSKVYALNGADGSFIYSAMQIYDPTLPAGSRWSFGPNPNVGGNNFFSQDSGCAWIKGKLYLFGGWGAVDPETVGSIKKLTWVYDPTTSTWADTGKNIKGTPTWLFGYTNSKNKAYFAGGSSTDTSLTPSPSAQSFTPAGGWVKLPNLPIPGGSNVAGLLAPGMGILGTTVEVFGGAGLNTVSGSLIIQVATLQCATGCTAWSDAGKNLNTARWLAASAYQGGTTPTLYDAAGETASGGVGVIIKSAEKTT